MAATVAMLQLDYPAGESRRDRVERVVALLRSGPAADLYVLPELWDVGYFAFDRYAAEAEPLDGPVGEALADAARGRSAVVVGGSVLERGEDGLHNTTVVFGPDGSLLGTYRKHHLFGYRSQEAALLVPGPGPEAVDTGVGRLGLATCFDLRFPAHFAELRAVGSDLLVVPAAWPAARVEHWRVLCRARAIETQTPLVAVNGVGPCVGVELAGSSVAVDAQGEVLAAGAAGSGAGWVCAEVDFEATAAWRREFPLDDYVVAGTR
jgi:predicted amidohydrolase